MCSCDPGNRPDFQSNTWQRARKPHVCVECRRAIKPGETYQRIVVCFDGSINSEKECAACSRVHHAFWQVSTEDCSPPFGEVLECARELIRNDLERAFVVAFLTPSKWEWQRIEFERGKERAA